MGRALKYGHGRALKIAHKPSPHQSPTFRSTLYKFIVMGPLGLDPVHRWARSENRDPTIGPICGKVACAMISVTAC